MIRGYPARPAETVSSPPLEKRRSGGIRSAPGKPIPVPCCRLKSVFRRPGIRFLLPGLLLVLTAGYSSALAAQELRDGDIVFQISRSLQSKAIQLATHSPYSHMGIVFIIGGKPRVLEATTPVSLTPWKLWAMKGVGGHVVVKRLKAATRILTPEVVKKMRSTGLAWLGRNYDGKFSWSDDRLYCSELVWKIYKRAAGIEIGKLAKLKDFDLTHPVVRMKLKQRYAGRIPLDEPVIAPSAVFDSGLLTVVYRK